MSTKDSGMKMDANVVEVSNSGLMDRYTRDTGNLTKPMVEVV